MTRRTILSLGAAAIVAIAAQTDAVAQHGGGHGFSGHVHHPGAVVGSGYGRVWPYFGGLGYGGGFYGAYPPILMIAPGGFFPPMAPAFVPGGGPLLPAPPPGLLAGQQRGLVRRASVRRNDLARSAQLVTLGDRLFRAGNIKKAEERYQQAQRAAVDQADPRVRLAQVAFARGHYAEAAALLRDAETAQPGWLVTAGDIQKIYGEPAEFARHLARLESYVQTHPEDRDAWLVLGAEFFLTGRTSKAADVFKRLNDPRRKSDVALAAFLDASNQAAEAAPQKPRAAEPAPNPNPVR